MVSTTSKLTYTELQANLEQHFCSEQYFKITPFTSTIMTEGIKYFCDKCSCYWLLEFMLFNGLSKLSKQYNFLLITVNVNKRGTCHITVKEDSNEELPLLLNKKVRDLCQLIPVGEYKFYLIENVLLLPSEY